VLVFVRRGGDYLVLRRSPPQGGYWHAVKRTWLAEWLTSLGANVTGFSLPPPTKPSLFSQLDASRRICAQWGPLERPRIVAMTANAMQGDRELCIAAGMDDYLTKPIRVERLIEALNLAQGRKED